MVFVLVKNMPTPLREFVTFDTNPVNQGLTLAERVALAWQERNRVISFARAELSSPP